MKLGEIYLGVFVKLEEFDNEYTWMWSYSRQSDNYNRDLYNAAGVSLIDGKKHTPLSDTLSDRKEGDINVVMERADIVFRMKPEDEIDEELFAKLKTLVAQGGLPSNGYFGKVKEIADFLRQQLALKKAAKAQEVKKPTKKPSLFKRIAANVKTRKENEKSNDDIYTI